MEAAATGVRAGGGVMGKLEDSMTREEAVGWWVV